jgi:hypothetical protein
MTFFAEQSAEDIARPLHKKAAPFRERLSLNKKPNSPAMPILAERDRRELIFSAIDRKHENEKLQ